MSFLNGLLLSILTFGVVWSAVHRQGPAVMVLSVALLYLGFATRRSLRRTNSDMERIDAAQPSDEREKLLVELALAWVGKAAVALELALVVWQAGLGTLVPDSAWRLIVYSAVWGFANRMVASGRSVRGESRA